MLKRVFDFFGRCILIIKNILQDPSAELTWIYSKYCRVKKNRIVFSSYAGQGYVGNPKYICDEILKQGLNWELVWLCKDPDAEVPRGIRVVEYGTNSARRMLASAHAVIDNVRSSARPPKKKEQIYIQTWHGGIGFKNCEQAVEDKLGEEYVRLAKEDGQNCDAIVSNCSLLSDLYRKYFWLNPDTEILEYGLPRNDPLFDEALVREKYESVRRTYGLAQDQKIILYMPTFRADHSMDAYAIDYEGIISAFEQRFGEKFAIVVRLHPNVQKQADMIPYSEKIVNGTKYADVQELYMAADYLITDYSSAAFDFALLNRPVFLCMLDFEAYAADRGVNHVFAMCPFPHIYSNREFISAIENFSEEDYQTAMKEFRKVWQPFDDGHAAERTVNWLKEKMKK